MNQTQSVILQELGLQGSSIEQQSELLDMMAELIQNRVMVRISEILTDEQLQELTNLSENSEQEDALYVYLQQNVPTYNLLVQEETRKLRNELKRSMGELNSQLKKGVAEVDLEQSKTIQEST